MPGNEKKEKFIDYTSPYDGIKYKLTFETADYTYGGIFMQLYSVDENGLRQPFAIPTTCVPNALYDDELAFRLYDGNEALFEALLKAGIIEQPHRQVRSGYAEYPVCRLK